MPEPRIPHRSTTPRPVGANQVEQVAVVGGGVMGVGIVHAFLGGECRVTLVDVSTERVNACVAQLHGIIDGGVTRGKLTGEQARAMADRLATAESIEDLPDGLDLAIEAVPERLPLKHETLGRMAARQPRLLATNTSALSIDLLAQGIAAAGDFLGLHFFNPVWASRLVEIVLGSATTDRARSTALDVVAQIGKRAIVVADSPGFATSRLGIALGLEAMRMLEDGVASVEDIDQAMMLGYKHPVGPLMLTDIVGLDVRLDVASNLSQAYGSRFEPPRILRELVADGALGQKTGRGFYAWDGDHAKPSAA